MSLSKLDWVERLQRQSTSSPLSEVLNGLLVLSREMGLKKVSKWVELEIGGYVNSNNSLDEDDIVPKYRTVTGQYFDHNGSPLYIQDPELQFILEQRLRYSIEELEAILTKNKQVSIQNVHAFNVIKNVFKIEVNHYVISPISVRGVLAAIRKEAINKIYEIKLQLEAAGVELDVKGKKVHDMQPQLKRIFISHSSRDSMYVGELIDLLESIGLNEEQIFCTSFEPYAISLGEDFLSRIKAELKDESLVLFVLTNNFYNSPVCMCEMGATWMISKQHIPIIIPPFGFADIKGVIPLTQGMDITDSDKLNRLKQQLQEYFGLREINATKWERRRNSFIRTISTLIDYDTVSKKDGGQLILTSSIDAIENDEQIVNEKMNSNEDLCQLIRINDGYRLMEYLTSANELHLYNQNWTDENNHHLTAFNFFNICKSIFGKGENKQTTGEKIISGNLLTNSINSLSDFELGVFLKRTIHNNYSMTQVLNLAITNLKDNSSILSTGLYIENQQLYNYSQSFYK